MSGFLQPLRFCLLGLASLAQSTLHPDQTPLLASKSTNPWPDLTPSPTLAFHPCFAGFECARLALPLDHSRPSTDDDQLALAVIRLPAGIPVTDPRYGGAIVLNPGGPGESGVHQALAGGRSVQRLLSVPTGGNSTTKLFDIVSFDPRGVNNTTPRLTCLPDAPAMWDWVAGVTDYGLLWSSDAVLGHEMAAARALGRSCEQNSNASRIIPHLNTAQVAADIVALVEKLGQWRETQAAGEIAASSLATADAADVRRRTAWRPGREHIQYWGVSYGTLLGQTLATLYPARIARMLLDGVMDADDYFHQRWSTNLRDADRIISQFSRYCYDAGPAKCPLHTGTSGRDVEREVERILLGLKAAPLVVPGEGWQPTTLLTYGDVHLRLLSAMYFPRSHAEDFFRHLAAIRDLDYDRVRAIPFPQGARPTRSAACLQQGPFSEACLASHYNSALGTNQAISCMDSARLRDRNLTPSTLKTYLERLQRQSRWISPNWGRNRLQCLSFTSEPAWPFDGPVGAHTAHPILAIGNTYETVCPLANAVDLQRLFPGAVALQHDIEGHCSHAYPGVCTARAVRDYFQTGKLPEVGTVCAPEARPFVGCVHKDEQGRCRELKGEDAQIWDAAASLSRDWTM